MPHSAEYWAVSSYYNNDYNNRRIGDCEWDYRNNYRNKELYEEKPVNIVEKFEDQEVRKLDIQPMELSLSFLKQTVPSVKIHKLSELEKNMFEVKVKKSNKTNQKYLFDYSNNKISIKRGLFVVTIDGKIYITYDRDQEKAIKIKKKDEEYVIAHYSFTDIDDTGLTNVVFAGLITVEDGLPKKITNESGTFRPTMYQTCYFRAEFCNKCLQIDPKILEIDLFIDKFINIEDQITELILYGYETECTKLLNQLQETVEQTPIKEYKQNMQEYVDRIKKTIINFKENQNITNNNQSVKAENEELACIICFVNKRDTLFLPCKHINSCAVCTATVNKCPECRVSISHKIGNIYIN